MKSKPDWDSLSHTDKLKVLRDTAVDQITADYRFGDADDSAFRGRLARQLALWQPHRFDGLPKQMGNPPNKEVVLSPGGPGTPPSPRPCFPASMSTPPCSTRSLIFRRRVVSRRRTWPRTGEAGPPARPSRPSARTARAAHEPTPGRQSLAPETGSAESRSEPGRIGAIRAAQPGSRPAYI